MRSPRRAGDKYEKYLEQSSRRHFEEIKRVTISDSGIEKKNNVDNANFVFYEGPLDKFEEVFKRVSGSGSSAEKKGDLKSESYLVQAKRTDKKSFTVKLIDLKKAEQEAMNLGKKPLFIVGFYSGDKVTDEWVLMPKWMVGNF